jgi:hypothetical protein
MVEAGSESTYNTRPVVAALLTGFDVKATRTKSVLQHAVVTLMGWKDPELLPSDDVVVQYTTYPVFGVSDENVNEVVMLALLELVDTRPPIFCLIIVSVLGRAEPAVTAAQLMNPPPFNTRLTFTENFVDVWLLTATIEGAAWAGDNVTTSNRSSSVGNFALLPASQALNPIELDLYENLVAEKLQLIHSDEYPDEDDREAVQFSVFP